MEVQTFILLSYIILLNVGAPMKTNLINSKSDVEKDDVIDIPIHISDILEVCKNFSLLGLKIQGQIDYIIEFGLEESMQASMVSVASLPHIKQFLTQIVENPYFGDASTQASDCILQIEKFENNNPQLFLASKAN